MNIMSSYEKHIRRSKGTVTEEYIIEVVGEADYTSVESLMFRGNNRRNVYSKEKVRIGENDSTRRHHNYR